MWQVQRQYLAMALAAASFNKGAATDWHVQGLVKILPTQAHTRLPAASLSTI